MTEEHRELGIRAEMSRADAQRLADALEELWIASVGPVRTLSRDLRALARFFDPLATGGRVRRELAALPPAAPLARSLTEPLVVKVQDDKLLVTPEGRIVLGLLRDALVTDVDPVTFNDDAVRAGHAELLELYRGWARQRLNQTVELLTGQAEPLRIPSIGFLLVLLVNQTVDADRALPGKDELEKVAVVQEAVFESAAAFARALDVSQRGLRPGSESLYRGWWAGEGRRRLPEAIEVRPGIHIRTGCEQQVLELVARELARRPVDRAAVASAFDVLVSELRSREPELAQFGLAFERPPDTRRLRERVLDAFARERATRSDDGLTRTP